MHLLRVTALVITVLRSKSFKSPPSITTTEIAQAENICIKSSMHYTKPQFESGNLKSLGAQVDEDGIINVVSRAASEMESHYGRGRFPSSCIKIRSHTSGCKQYTLKIIRESLKH